MELNAIDKILFKTLKFVLLVLGMIRVANSTFCLLVSCFPDGRRPFGGTCNYSVVQNTVPRFIFWLLCSIYETSCPSLPVSALSGVRIFQTPTWAILKIYRLDKCSVPFPFFRKIVFAIVAFHTSAWNICQLVSGKIDWRYTNWSLTTPYTRYKHYFALIL